MVTLYSLASMFVFNILVFLISDLTQATFTENGTNNQGRESPVSKLLPNNEKNSRLPSRQVCSLGFFATKSVAFWLLAIKQII